MTFQKKSKLLINEVLNSLRTLVSQFTQLLSTVVFELSNILTCGGRFFCNRNV